EAMKYAGTGMAGLGVDVERTTAMIGVMANVGLRGRSPIWEESLLRRVNAWTRDISSSKPIAGARNDPPA
ncbi:hypothetical protein JVW21_20850, partial [Vibrio cholerae O1]|uniref:phage tail tape measure protein n=1 Tax=Vibrio cholerae TaxID=666 RepID=UPI001C0F890D